MLRRVDQNQPSIVALFRKLGASVQNISGVGKGCPDLIVGICNRNYLVEIKDGEKPKSNQKLTEKEELFFNTWKGQVCIINSEDEAINFIKNARKAGENMMLSKCHKVFVNVVGATDFSVDKQLCTAYYVCSKCGKDCDVLSLTSVDGKEPNNERPDKSN